MYMYMYMYVYLFIYLFIFILFQLNKTLKQTWEAKVVWQVPKSLL